jgi:hypothetical protein
VKAVQQGPIHWLNRPERPFAKQPVMPKKIAIIICTHFSGTKPVEIQHTNSSSRLCLSIDSNTSISASLQKEM